MSLDKLFCLGNPLLDVSANVDQAFLDKYGVKLNNAILAEEQHLPVFDDLVQSKNPLFIAGGATQNTARVAQWQVNQPGAVTYAGAIGKDKFGDELKKATKADALTTLYYEVDGSPTGTCAVLVVDKERSLIANLGAAEKYKIEWTLSESVQKAIAEAKIFYIAGFVMTHSADSIMHVAQHADQNNKLFTMNMAAPFLFQVPPFLAAFQAVWEYLDIIFGNESEAAVVSEAFQLGTTNVKEIAQKLACMPKKNSTRPRTVIITQGDEPTIVATPDSITEYPVPKVTNLVDTNGAGDAFCGGFLAMLIQGKTVAQAVEAGHYTAGVVIQRSGCQFSDAKRFGA